MSIPLPSSQRTLGPILILGVHGKATWMTSHSAVEKHVRRPPE